MSRFRPALVLACSLLAACGGVPRKDGWLRWLRLPAGHRRLDLALDGEAGAHDTFMRAVVFDPARGVAVDESPDTGVRRVFFLAEGQRMGGEARSAGYAGPLPLGLAFGMGAEAVQAILGAHVEEASEREVHADVDGVHVDVSLGTGGVFQVMVAGPVGPAPVAPPDAETLLRLVGCDVDGPEVAAARADLAIVDASWLVSVAAGVRLHTEQGVVSGVSFYREGARDWHSGHRFAAWPGALPLGLDAAPPDGRRQGTAATEHLGWSVHHYVNRGRPAYVSVAQLLPRTCGADPRQAPVPTGLADGCVEGDCVAGKGRALWRDDQGVDHRYEGAFRDGVPHGMGALELWRDGQRFRRNSGRFEAGRHVQGAVTWTEPGRTRSYTGALRDGQPDTPAGALFNETADRRIVLRGRIVGPQCVGTCELGDMADPLAPAKQVCVVDGEIVAESPCDEGG